MTEDRHDMEISVGYMLQYGVTLAAAVVLTGGVLYMRHAMHQPLPDYGHFRNVPSPLVSFRGEWNKLLAGDASAIMGAGLLLLILTPIARVLMCIVGFTRERNLLYIAVSSTVMAVLLYSLFHGH